MEFSVQDQIVTAMGAVATSIVGAMGEVTRRRSKRMENVQQRMDKIERDRARLSARQEIKVHAVFELAMLSNSGELDAAQRHKRAQEIKVEMLEALAGLREGKS